MRSYFPALNSLGLTVMIFGVLMGFPLGIAWYLGDDTTAAFDRAFAITFFAGFLLWALTRGKRRDLKPRDGFLLVASSWIFMPVFGALPLYLYLPDLTVSQAYFEAVSGLTATGASMVSEVESLPISINVWRTFLHWIGGMGVIVLVVAILPLLGIGGRQLFRVEVPTPMKDASLTPRITETAKGLWLTYTLLTVACGISLWLVGMDGWDALIHAFSVIGLGGFSSKDASLGYFNSVPVEMVVIVFALLAGLNYATHYLALTRHSLKPYLRDPEIPFYFGILAISVAMLTFYLMYMQPVHTFSETLRYVSFNIVSIATSLGLVTNDYSVWPLFAQLWILFLGSFVACSGSTGGGIKMMRAIMLYKQVYREIIRSLHPAAVHPVRLSDQSVPDNVLYAVLGFSFMYMVSVASLTLLMVASGADFLTASSAVVACLNNTGPGLGGVGPMGSYAIMNTLQIWILAFTMILGRLEIFTLLVVLTPAFWRR